MTNKKKKNEMLDMLNDFFPKKLTPGKVIRAKRQNFGISLEEVSKTTNISQSNLSLYENDKKKLGYVQATKIGLAIGLHPMSILFPNGIEQDNRFKRIIEKAKSLLQTKIPLLATE